MDGVDAVLVEIVDGEFKTLGGLTHAYPALLNATLHSAIAPDARLSLHELATLDVEVGECFAEAASVLLTTLGVPSNAVSAVGSHGQTLRHAPRAARPYSIQIGSPSVICARLGLTTVADFRAMDIAYGGEGAPLVPAFHEWLLRDPNENRVIVNIGGIANISLLPAHGSEPIAGYDTGPGNCLMDAWCKRHRGLAYDAGGQWAASGTVNSALLAKLLDDHYYTAAPPKSTGREVFNLAYLDAVLTRGSWADLAPADVQASLAELTVESLAREVGRRGHNWSTGLFVCGGGAHNTHLLSRLAARLAPVTVAPTTTLGLDPDLVEASAFAWLAHMRLGQQPIRMTTGPVAREVHLGALYSPTQF
jgi:anhydro-N-acetylmuramic acid kinase